MCIQNALQQHILDITNDGKDVADFFRATMHGQNPNAKFHHQMEAAKHLTKLGLPTAPSPSTGEGWDGGENSVRPEPRPEPVEGLVASSVRPELVEGHALDHATSSPSTAENRDEGEHLQTADTTSPPSMSAPVTDSDIINYKVARLIREETNDGYFIAEFLSRVMHGTAGQGRPTSEADRIRAATELMNRGLGRFGDTRDRRISNTQDDQELIHSGLARYIREHTDQGLEPAYFLLDVASGSDAAFSMHQRITATRELIRRGWDTNHDRVTPEDIAAYYERQEAREPTGYDNRLREWREKERAAQPVGATGQSPEDEPHSENRHSCGGQSLPLCRQGNPEAQDRMPEDEQQLEDGLFAHLSYAEIDRYEAMSAEGQAKFIEQQRQRRASRRSAVAQHITPSPSTDEEPVPVQTGESQSEDRRENPENINWNTPPQDDALSTSTPHLTNPAHPVTSESQTHIRSP